MIDDAYVNHMPVNTGGRGKDELRAFYRDDFIPSWPGGSADDAGQSRDGRDHIVDELRVGFTHSKRMNWLLPDVAPTHRHITIDFVVVIQFRGELVACERIYWDHASVLRQAGLLPD